MEATPLQIQAYADGRVRRRAEAIRALVIAMTDDKAAIDDVYAALTGSQSGWVDNRDPADPPHLLDAAAILSYNAFITAILAAITGHAEYPNVLRACVRPAELP